MWAVMKRSSSAPSASGYNAKTQGEAGRERKRVWERERGRVRESECGRDKERESVGVWEGDIVGERECGRERMG